MRTKLRWIGCVSLTFGLLTAAPVSYAQSPRPWVDPPPEGGALAPNSPSSAPSTGETKPSLTQPPETPASANAAVKDGAGKEQVPQQSEVSSTVEERPSSKSSAKKAITERKDRPQQTRSTAARNLRSKQDTQRRVQAARASRNTRAERIREGIDSGLEVMTLRTIEFPDGRRVQILTRPRPGAVSELLEAPD